MNKLKVILGILIPAAIFAQSQTIKVTGSGVIPLSGPTVTEASLLSPADSILFRAKLSSSSSLQWSKIVNVPTASATVNGITSATDWKRWDVALKTPGPIGPIGPVGPIGLRGLTGATGPQGSSYTNVEVYSGAAPVGIGLVDGSNTIFTLPDTPVGIPLVFLNGVKQNFRGQYASYGMVGKIITWLNPPTSGMLITVNYWK